jgi:hypothetical protein
MTRRGRLLSTGHPGGDHGLRQVRSPCDVGQPASVGHTNLSISPKSPRRWSPARRPERVAATSLAWHRTGPSNATTVRNRVGVVSPGPLRPRDTEGRAGARADLDPARAHPGPPATAAQDPVIPGPGHQPWVLGGAVCHPAPSGRDRRPALRQPPQTPCLLHFELKRCELTRRVEGTPLKKPSDR